jgi:hypothetical protein
MKRLIFLPLLFAFFVSFGQTQADKKISTQDVIGTYIFSNAGVTVEIVLGQNKKASLSSDLNGTPINGVNSKGTYSILKGNKIKVIWQKAVFNKTMGLFDYDPDNNTLTLGNGTTYYKN